MNCLEFSAATKLECTPVATRGGGVALFVPLNSTFCDGEPLPMYVIPSANGIQLTDGGDTLFHLHRTGFQILGDKRRWTSLKQAVEPLGVKMNSGGQIETWVNKESVSAAVERFTAAMITAAMWELDHQGLPIDGTVLIEEVVQYLKAIRPHARVRENVSLAGISGKVYQFPIAFDEVYVDAMMLNANASNSMVRKLVDIRAVPSEQDRVIEIAVDDRELSVNSKQDIKLLEILATPLKLSALQEEASRASTHH